MKVKKSYINAVKDTLKCYPLLSGHLEYLEKNLNALQGNDGMFGISYGNTRVQSSNISRITENTAIANIDEERELIKEITECKRKMDIMNLAVEHLSPFVKQIIKLRYLESKDWNTIADETMYSTRQCQNKATEGIEELAVVFYGDKAIEELKALKIS